MMCPIDDSGGSGSLWSFGLFIFLLVWVIFVPIVLSARLEKIIKLLQEKK